MYNVVSTQARSFLICSSSFLQVTRTAIKSWMGLKFGEIRPGLVELGALECLEKIPFLYNGRNVVSTPVLPFLMDLHYPCSYEDTRKSFDEFECLPDPIAN